MKNFLKILIYLFKKTVALPCQKKLISREIIPTPGHLVYMVLLETILLI